MSPATLAIPRLNLTFSVAGAQLTSPVPSHDGHCANTDTHGPILRHPRSKFRDQICAGSGRGQIGRANAGQWEQIHEAAVAVAPMHI